MFRATLFRLRRGVNSFMFNFAQSAVFGSLLVDDLINYEILSSNCVFVGASLSTLVVAIGTLRSKFHNEELIMGLLGSCLGFAVGMKARALGESRFLNELDSLLSLPTVHLSCQMTITLPPAIHGGCQMRVTPRRYN